MKKISDKDLVDSTKFYFNYYKEDLVYKNMNVEMLQFFLVKTEYKADGKIKSINDIRKYKDAIIWGAKIAKECLPLEFYQMWDDYLGGFRKKFVDHKKKGDVEEKGSHPILKVIFKLILMWALMGSNIFV